MNLKLPVIDNNSLVSIGLPVYNRPTLLEVALQSLLNQSYNNYEIIISDDCSSGNDVKKIVQKYMNIDYRIRYYRQNINLGATLNHKFVLKKARGKYFLWASEDDKWSPLFIEKCISIIALNGSAMTARSTYNNGNEEKTRIDPPKLKKDNNAYNNVLQYLFNMDVDLFHGLHTTHSISWYKNFKVFDYSEVCLVMSQILNHNYSIINEDHFTKFKDINKRKLPYREKYNYRYYPFFYHSSLLIINSNNLNEKEKINLLVRLVVKIMFLFNHHEKKHQYYKSLIMRFIAQIGNNLIRYTSRLFNLCF
jgi:glycosyltransferase involved in cell wall biosynthesis